MVLASTAVASRAEAAAGVPEACLSVRHCRGCHLLHLHHRLGRPTHASHCNITQQHDNPNRERLEKDLYLITNSMVATRLHEKNQVNFLSWLPLLWWLKHPRQRGYQLTIVFLEIILSMFKFLINYLTSHFIWENFTTTSSYWYWIIQLLLEHVFTLVDLSCIIKWLGWVV